ncbi:MAG TPA: HlyD family secretion protein [Steroidobacteraceae bacterium]|nr:HlyD family secretion protein [Steroidobacteraceae bacterium]
MASKEGESGPADSSDKEASRGPSGGGHETKPHSKRPLIIVAAVVLVGALVGFMVWFARRNEASTDDAYTDGNVVTMMPKVSGYVVALDINDNVHVKKGELLLRIDPRDYLAARQQAQAALQLAEAQLKTAQEALRIARVQYPAQLVSARAQEQSAAAVLEQAQRQYARQHEVDPRATTQENIDTATSQQRSASAGLRSAKAQVAIASLVPEQIRQALNAVKEREAQVGQASAQLEQANLNLGYTEVRAPCEGFITRRSVQLGDYVSPGGAMFLIVTPEVWVTANFKESQLGRMRPGDRVDITIDAYPGYKLSGRVQSIQQGSGSRFSAFPAENATGNFVKIVQRVPVKIIIDHGLDPNRPLPLGLSVSPVVHFGE